MVPPTVDSVDDETATRRNADIATAASDVIPSSGVAAAVRRRMSITSSASTVIHATYSPVRPAPPPAPPAELDRACIDVVELAPYRPTPTTTMQVPIPRRVPVTVAMASPMQQPQPTGYSATYALDPQVQPAARPQVPSYTGPPPMQGHSYSPPPYVHPMNPGNVAGAWPPNANAQPVAEPWKKRPILCMVVAGVGAIAITGVVLLVVGLLERVDRLEKQLAVLVASSVVTAQPPAPPPVVTPPPSNTPAKAPKPR